MKYILTIICALSMTSCATHKVGDMGKTINQLSSADAVVSADNFVVYTASNGDARKAAMSVLQTYMQANLNFITDDNSLMGKFVEQQEAAPYSTIDVVTSDNTWIILTASGSETIAAISLPGTGAGTFATPVDGQEVVIITNDIISAISVWVSFSPTTIEGAPSSMTADGFARMKYNATNNKWYRVG